MRVDESMPLRPLRAFLQCRRGLAALEFALVAPVLILILIGIAEYSHYSTIVRRAHMTADSMALVLTQYGDEELTHADRVSLFKIWGVINQTAEDSKTGRNAQRGLARSISSIVFDPPPPGCGPACPRTPRVLWIFANPNGVPGASLRQCEQQVINNGAKVNGASIPVGVIGPAPVVAVDLAHRYRPLFLSSIIPETLIEVSVFRSTRDGAPLRHVATNSNLFTECD